MPKETTLQPICKWKLIFIKAHHLKVNWEKGRYTLAPILRGHKERVLALDCDGKLLNGVHKVLCYVHAKSFEFRMLELDYLI